MGDFINTFSGGLSQDLDLQQRRPNTYQFSGNGRLIFNTEGDFAYENARGNKYYFSLPSGYLPIGGCEFPSRLFIASTNNVNSEFGILTIDVNDVPTYTTVFNDQFDFNGDKLGLSASNLITSAWGVVENPSKQRVYFTTNTVDPFIFNIVAGLQENNSDFQWGNYQPNPLTLKYPWWYSVHSMSYYADFRMGRVKFVRKGDPYTSPATGGGSLKTGVFQYFFQLVTREGYITPKTPLTRHIFLTSININSVANAHEYYMDSSNLMTPYSIMLELSDVDARYWKLQVGYVYSIAEKVTVESNIFYEQLLDGTTTTINVEHQQHSGTPVNLDEFNAYPVAITQALAIVEKDQRLWLGNIGTIGDLSIDTSIITITTVSDPAIPGDILGAAVNTPLTNSAIFQDSTVSIPAYVDESYATVYDSYTVDNDYFTYAGQQIEHLKKGYWRGETYPFGIMLFDRKGIPFYVQNIQDFTFPQQYEGVSNQLVSGTSDLKVLHPIFSNIVIPYSLLYDQYGRQRVSAFAIVRCIRQPRILCQGILADALYARDAGGDPDEKDLTRPLAIATQFFDTTFKGTDSRKYDTNDYDMDDAGHEYGNRPFTQVFHSPELSFGFDIYKQTGQTTFGVNDFLQYLGAVQSIYATVSAVPETVQLAGNNRSFYAKHYQTLIVACHYAVGATSRIANIVKPAIGETIEGYDPDDVALSFYNQAQITLFSVLYFALGCPASWVIKTKDFKIMEPPLLSGHTTRYALVNYVAPSSNYYSLPNDKRLYISTGHFQPLSQTVINNVLKRHNSESPQEDDGLIFNSVHVYGGDCIVNMWDFVRLYPKYSFDISAFDYSLGHIVPIESNLNTWLRRGRSLAKSGIEPNSTAKGDGTVFPDGVSQNQPEAFDLNDVLLHQENLQFFPSLPKDITVDQKVFPNRWVYTELKFYGELQDNYRKILANNYQDVIGIYGDISGALLWRNQVYSFQKNGWGRLRINDRSIISAENQQAVTTGAGITIDGLEYFSHLYGTQHIHTLTTTEFAMYWIDVSNRAVMKYNAEGQQILSDTKGLHDWANKVLPYFDNPQISVDGSLYVHLRSVYDLENNEINFIYANNVDRPPADIPILTGTLVYNENIDTFTDFSGFFSLWATKFGNKFFTNFVEIGSKIYLQNKGLYGQYYDQLLKDTVITITINPAVGVSKLFDNVVMNINQEGATLLTRVDMITETQTMSMLNFQSFNKQKYRYDNLYSPLWDVTNLERVQGKTCRLTFTFTNDGTTLVKITSNKTTFRPAPNQTLPPR